MGAERTLHTSVILLYVSCFVFFFSSRRRHTRCSRDWSSDVCSSDLFQFKQDESGYLGKQRRHLYVLDVESGKTTMLTSGDYDELLPAWAPDGKSLAFVSKRRPDFDRDSNWDLYVIDAGGGAAAPRQLTTFEGPDNDPDTESRPAWSPDGHSIAYLQGGPLKLLYYAVQKLAVVPAAGGLLASSRRRSIATWRAPCGRATGRPSPSCSRTTAPSGWRACRPRAGRSSGSSRAPRS